MTIPQELAQIETDLLRSSLQSHQRWEAVRTGAMRDYVLEQLRLAPIVADLGPEWYPICPDHPFPCWRREVEGEEVQRLRNRLLPGGRALCATMVWEPLHEVLIELHVGDLVPDRGVVLIHPTLFADYLVAFDRTSEVERLAEGRYMQSLREYDGPGGQMFRRPFVYHGLHQGWSAGEIRVSFTLS